MEKSETLPVQTNNKKSLGHRYCPYCYPEVYPGMLALCGWKLKGIFLDETYDKCVVCIDLVERHYNSCPEVWHQW